MVQILLVVLFGLLIQTVQLAPVEKAFASSGRLIVYVTPNSAPFVSRNSLNIANGLNVNLINTIAARLNMEVHYKFRALANLLEAVQSNPNSIAISTISITPERTALVDFVSYFQSGSNFLVLTEAAGTYNGLSDLCGKSVAVQTGTTQETDVDDQAAKCTSPITIYSLQTYGDVVDYVANGTVDVGVADQALNQVTADDSSNDLTSTGTVYNVLPYGIAVNQAQTALASQMAQAINDLTNLKSYPHILRENEFEPTTFGVCPSKLYTASSPDGMKVNHHPNAAQCAQLLA